MAETICPAGNWCKLAMPDTGPPCGYFHHLSATAAPGTLCTVAIWDQFRDLSVPCPEEEMVLTPTSKQQVHKAGLLIELGVHPEVHDREANGYFGQAEHILAQEVHNPHTQYFVTCDARLLQLFLPDFVGLRTDRQPTAEDRLRQQLGIRALMKTARKALEHQDKPLIHIEQKNHQPCYDSGERQKGDLVRLAVLDRFLEAGLDVLPTTGRSLRRADAFVQNNGAWLPVKINIDSVRKFRAPGRARLINFTGLVRRTCQQINQQVPRSEEPGLIDDVVREIEGSEHENRRQFPDLQQIAEHMTTLLRSMLEPSQTSL